MLIITNHPDNNILLGDFDLTLISMGFLWKTELFKRSEFLNDTKSGKTIGDLNN